MRRKSINLTGEFLVALMASRSSAEKTDRLAVCLIRSSVVVTSTTCSTTPTVVIDCDKAYRSSLDI
jgi:hypothetical protein